MEQLSGDLDAASVPDTPTVVEVESGRAVLQLMTHDVARAAVSVALLAPSDAFPLLAPALRRPFSAGLPLTLCSTAPVDLGFAEVSVVADTSGWPGMPIIAVVDDRSAVLAYRARRGRAGALEHRPGLRGRRAARLRAPARAYMTEPADEAFLALQREYLAELPARLDELRADVAAFRAGQAESAASLKTRLHRLAGSGGSYGFPEISEVARELELWVADSPQVAEAGRLRRESSGWPRSSTGPASTSPLRRSRCRQARRRWSSSLRATIATSWSRRSGSPAMKSVSATGGRIR